jgi:excinuclease ABC subunit A
MADHLLGLAEGTKVQLLAPLVSGRKGEYKKVLDQARKDGFVRVRLDGRIMGLEEEVALDKNQKHDIDVVVDRLVMKKEVRQRLTESIETALTGGERGASGPSSAPRGQGDGTTLLREVTPASIAVSP